MRRIWRLAFAATMAFLATVVGFSPTAFANPLTSSFAFGPPLYNVAVAYSDSPQHPAFDQAWMVTATNWPDVVAVNKADATTMNCTGCQAAAVAFQVVIASDISSLQLTNNAFTLQTQCLTCDAASVADQWVVASTTQRLQLTGAGQAALFSVHRQLSNYVRSGATPSQISAEAPKFEAEVDNILSQDVVTVPQPPPFRCFYRLNRCPPGAVSPRPEATFGPARWRAPPLLRSRVMAAAELADPPSSQTVRPASDSYIGPGESITVFQQSGFTIYHYSQASSAGP